ncbi:heavy metal-associated isoprenylated plant protein 7-like isoform X1 [Iris pallida]|uniref:Heavy metal-associated isoprenylated plant protein 7-like isoform X1 n=1 Tax=Iris pallida TaxID=29817 RepID=A0AAX6DVY2_IRIPA|nr:heavy metal-associated isoprenylated plant protein 7-like isoform X1 [Iris pallida]
MGEEKKPEEKKPDAAEEKPKAEDEPKKEGGGAGEEKKEGEAPAAQPPPPEEVEMRVFMHCEGCARKVKRSLKGFDGVEEVRTDCRNHKLVVKGKKAAEDPLKVVERVQKKTGRKVELLTPLPPPKPEETKKEEEKKEEDKPKKEEEKKEEPMVIAVVLKVHMHCEACAQEIKKRILRMKGVQSADSELKASQVTVKGVFDPPKLVEYVHKRTGKHAVIVKAEPVEKKAAGDEKPKEEEEEEEEEEEKVKAKAKDEKKDGDKAEGEKKDKEGDSKEEAKKESSTEETAGAATTTPTVGAKVEQKRNEMYCYYPSIPRYPMEYAAAVYPQMHHQQLAYAPQPPAIAYPPQMFSDENPNACSVM